jgi:hypothetical protein
MKRLPLFFTLFFLFHFAPVFQTDFIYAALSPNELFEDGGFENPTIKVNADTEQGIILEGANRVMQLIKHGHHFAWTPPEAPIWNTEYILSFRIKTNNTEGSRLCLWNQLPDQHEPPKGPIFSKYYKGTSDWTTEEVRFTMPIGISRFILFLDHVNSKGWCRIDDISIRPADEIVPKITGEQKHIGSLEQEQTCWIWSNKDFPWTPVHNHNRELAKPVKEESVLFRRSFTLPKEVEKVQAVFCGDDFATLFIDNKEIGQNQNLQDIAKIPLELKSGKHELQFRVENKFGPAGLAGRIEWFDQKGQRSFIATNNQWECSTDAGNTWKKAEVLTVVTPAATQFHWLYPHLEKHTYRLLYTLPKGATHPRLAIRSTGSLSISFDDQPPIECVSAGKIVKVALTKESVERIVVELSDISQPPLGQGTLQYTLNGKTVNRSLEQFKMENGKTPVPINAFYPGKGWAHNIATFDAASSLPIPSHKHEHQIWQKTLLKNAKPIWTLGKTDDSSVEFAEFKSDAIVTETISIPLQNTKQCPRGLELRWQPELSFRFDVPVIPKTGAVFELNVEDADAMVTQVAVLVNGIFVGMPQVIGYDQIPGGRTTNRSWMVTIPAERFVKGENKLSLRLVPSSYTKKGEVVNQSDEYIALMNLRTRKENSYPTSDWLHWDMLALYALPDILPNTLPDTLPNTLPDALPKTIPEPINGRPVYMGTNMGYVHLKGFKPFEEFVLRDLEYLGMKQSGSPIRIGVWDKGQYNQITPEALDKLLDSLNERGLSPYFLFEPGRLCNNWEDFEKSNEVEVIKKHGSKVVAVEVGNEVDHPLYGWDQMSMSVAYATIQKQSVMGQALKKYANNPNLKITGEGWYHAWNYGVIDAQARKEVSNDSGFTDDLSAHDYGRSYIQPALTYYSLYGVNLGDPKAIWVTECGSWTPNDENVFEFDVNLRGNISYATYIVQYLLYPYDNEMKRFSMLTEENADAKILEKTRIFRRLLHAYALHGKPIPYKILNESELKNQLVQINPVLVNGGVKLAMINFSNKEQKVKVEFILQQSGVLTGNRYGDGETVATATKKIELKAIPQLLLEEILAPGETVLYDCILK